MHLLRLTALTLFLSSTFFLQPAVSNAQTDRLASQNVQTLIEALENDEARAALLEALRAMGEGDAGSVVPPAASAANDSPTAQVPSWAARTAEASSNLAASLTTGTLRVFNDIRRLSVLPSLLTPERRGIILTEGLALLLTAIVTLIIYRLLRVLSRRVRASQSGQGDLLSRRAITFSIQALLRLSSVVFAWMVGYALAGFAFGGQGLALSQVLYLNAFLIVGLASVVLSVFVSHDARDMTFARLPLEVETVIYRSVRTTFGFLTYGLVAAVPISQVWLNFVVARSLRTIIVTVGALIAIAAIYRISRTLAKVQEPELIAESVGQPDAEDEGLTQTIADSTISIWDRVWPLLAYSFVVVAYLVALANPNQMVELVGRAALFSGLGLACLLIALRAMTFASETPNVALPSYIERALPPLAPRLSAFLPLVLVVIGLLLTLTAIGLTLDGWGLLSLGVWIDAGGSAILWRLATVVLFAFLLILGWSMLTAWIDTQLTAEIKGKQVSARSRTLLALFRNAVSIAIVVFGGMTLLSELGIDIAPLLAGAGVIGLAIGFGAQKLVQDIITGIFIQLENAINEGDVITVAGITGGVEKLTIRSVALRDLAGAYHLIPFSAVDTVANFMRKFGYHVEVVGVAYDSDLEVVQQAMHDAFDVLKAGPHGINIIAPLEWHGVVGLADSSVNLRARIKTKPGQQWALGRAYTGEVKKALDAAGVEIPYPHRELRLPNALLERLAPPTKAGSNAPS